MIRRDFTLSCLGALAALGTAGAGIFPATAAAQDSTEKSNTPKTGRQPHISFLLYEGMTALDLIGPAEFLAGAQFTVDYVWRDRNPVYAETRSNKRLGFVPTATFADVQKTDILCVPGTSNPYAQIVQQDMVEWVAHVGQNATWVTSVCTGAFILGAAGLLKGYKATTHWSLLDDLSYFGATPTSERVVHDRNRVTGAGVTSGMDFGLVLLALLSGDTAAKTQQLMLEYDPNPPFNSGSPKTAAPKLLETAREKYGAYLKQVAPQARNNLDAAAKRLSVVVRK